MRSLIQLSCGTILLVSILVSGCAYGNQEVSSEALDPLVAALRAEDMPAIHSAVARARRSLGDRAGLPEVADTYRTVPDSARTLTPEEAQVGFSKHFERLETMRWWKIGVDPTKLTAPLRAPASVITGMVAAHRAELDGSDRCLEIAIEAADFLLWAQEQGEAGLYPFPAARGASNDRAMQVGSRFLDRAERAKRLDEVIRNGWAVEDLDDGGLQFDNGECGLAMLELYSVTSDSKYLESVRKAARWAMARPLSPNWNYNAFSVDLLAALALVTGESEYLDAAIHKALLGVIPGQLIEGPHAGRWLDPHNARPPYHFIMMRSLTRLAAAMPHDHPERKKVIDAIRLGLIARNTEIVERGVMNKDKAVETLLLVTSAFAHDEEFLRDTRSDSALKVVLRLISDEYRSGKLPLGPGSWGLSLERMASTPPQGAN